MKNNPNGILIFNKDLSKNDIEKIKEEWKQLYRRNMKSCNIVLAGKNFRYISL